MHHALRLISKVAERNAPSRILSFNQVHVFKTMQMMEKEKKISRSIMMCELDLGEGSVKTLVKHLKVQGLVENSNAGMWLTNKGRTIYAKLQISMPKEITIPKCSISLGKFNHAILLKNMSYNIKSGIEQRDEAIKAGAIGATTLIFKHKRLEIPGTGEDITKSDPKTYSLIMKTLEPEENDVIIIASSQNKKIAEMAVKSTALYTLEDNQEN